MDKPEVVDVEAYVDAAAAMTAMPLDNERRTAVVGVVARIAVFAADLNALPLPRDVEIAGRFTP